MSLPNAVIDWWVGDRWTHKERFAREVPLNAQRLTLTFHRTTYIKWSIVLPLSDEAPCLRNRSTTSQGHSGEVRWPLTVNIVLPVIYFPTTPQLCTRFFGKTFNSTGSVLLDTTLHTFSSVRVPGDSPTVRNWSLGIDLLYLDRMSSKIKTVC